MDFSKLLLDPQFESLVLTLSAAVVAVIAAVRHRRTPRLRGEAGEADASVPGPAREAGEAHAPDERARRPPQSPEPAGDNTPPEDRLCSEPSDEAPVHYP